MASRIMSKKKRREREQKQADVELQAKPTGSAHMICRQCSQSVPRWHKKQWNTGEGQGHTINWIAEFCPHRGAWSDCSVKANANNYGGAGVLMGFVLGLAMVLLPVDHFKPDTKWTHPSVFVFLSLFAASATIKTVEADEALFIEFSVN